MISSKNVNIESGNIEFNFENGNIDSKNGVKRGPRGVGRIRCYLPLSSKIEG